MNNAQPGAIRTKSANRLDALVAEHVLGWRAEAGLWYGEGSEEPVALQPFSTDLKLAWSVGEKICEQGFRLQLDGSRLWQARFYKSAAHTLETRSYAATSREPAAAICLAALAVLGIDGSQGSAS